MRILVTGATGFIGRPLVSALIERDHEVVVVSRDPREASSAVPLVHRHVGWNPSEEPLPAVALDGVDAVIHLAGETVVGKWTPEKKARIRDSRVLGTRNLVQAMRDRDERPRQLLSASAIGYYGERGDEELTENAGPGADFLSTVGVEWESEVGAAAELGLETVSLRIGIVLHPEDGALKQMLLPFRLGVGGPLGDGRQWWSWIHRDDLVRMFLTALDQHWTGVFNATAPMPARQADFAKTLGAVLGRPAVLPAPEFALRTLFGEFAVELLSSKRVVPAAAIERGFEFRFAHVQRALLDLID